MSDDPAYILKPGEAYPEEVEDLRLDEELHRANELAHKGMQQFSLIKHRYHSTRDENEMDAWREFERIHDEYEKLCQDTDQTQPDTDKT